MPWVTPSETDAGEAKAKRHFRANSGHKAQEYSAPVLGLIFLRFAEVRFATQRDKLEKSTISSRRGSRVDEPAAYYAEGILYLPAEARFDWLLNHPEAEHIGAKVNDAMRDIEKHNRNSPASCPSPITFHQHPPPPHRSHRTQSRRMLDPACGPKARRTE